MKNVLFAFQYDILITTQTSVHLACTYVISAYIRLYRKLVCILNNKVQFINAILFDRLKMFINCVCVQKQIDKYSPYGRKYIIFKSVQEFLFIAQT